MKKRKGYAALLLVLAMSFSLMACGGSSDSSDSSDSSTDTIPDSIEDLVIDDSVKYDYSSFFGTWLGEDGSVLIVEHIEDITNSERFELSDADNELLASGNIQYVEEYDCVYAYNEHDGIAYRCRLDEDNVLYIDSVGTFDKVSGDAPGETIGDEVSGDAPEETIGDEGDLAVLFGTWYLDGDIFADSSIDIDYTGTIWSLYERSSDGDWSEVDYGTIRAAGENQYEAVSDAFEDVIYDLYLEDNDTMYWGGEYDCFMRV